MTGAVVGVGLERREGGREGEREERREEKK
jgi:hypothetical protein